MTLLSPTLGLIPAALHRVLCAPDQTLLSVQIHSLVF